MAAAAAAAVDYKNVAEAGVVAVKGFADVGGAATSGQCCVNKAARINCTSNGDGKVLVKECPDCGYQYCSYHFRATGALASGGHCCRNDRGNNPSNSCSVLGLAQNRCSGKLTQCLKCAKKNPTQSWYCAYHISEGSWYGMMGGHVCG
ncbi:unnamed protein product [Prorocentrum cordatum]|uniref:Uncharacterized protein n=1 Tax=Prorocentrum cordatum TaxID=2364126 RepID=A0ABN9SSE9_9DINO|nr:unnamed protein product [Polarella glacialis]